MSRGLQDVTPSPAMAGTNGGAIRGQQIGRGSSGRPHQTHFLTRNAGAYPRALWQIHRRLGICNEGFVSASSHKPSGPP